MNTELSRVSGLVDSNGTSHLADYTYLGRNRTAQVDLPEPGVKFTWLWQTGDTPTPPADPYTGWDRFGRAVDLRWIKTSSGAALERLQHGYDRAGNRLYRKNLVAAGSDQQDELYGYDGLYQLKEFQRGELNSGNNGMTGTIAAEEDMTFDPTGNWNAYVVQAGGSTTLNQTRTHNRANGLTHINSATTYVAEDLAGNMTKVPKPGSWSAAFDLKYDAWNRLIEVKDGGTTVAEYRYDGLNRRTKKVTGSTTRHYYYSDQWQILEERVNTSTSADRQFVWGVRYIDDLVLRDKGSERLYVLQDYFQPTAIVNTSGTVLERYGYTAFGTSRVMDASFVTQTASSYEWETRYGAYRWDGETGLCQVRHRYLHSGLGRWVTRDPIGYEDGVNFYAYVENNPLSWIDPDGLEPVSHPHYNKGGVMVHSEVPMPGGGRGGVHIQIGNQKWHFNTQTGSFEGTLPKDVEKLLRQDKKFRRAIGNACNRVNLQGGFAPKYGGGVGRFIPALAALLTLAQGSAIADEVERTARDYLRGLEAGEDVTIEAAILRNLFNNLAPLAGDVAFPVLLR